MNTPTTRVLSGVGYLRPILFLAWAAGLTNLLAAGPELELELQRRDPATGQVSTTLEKVPASKIAIVVIDLWNYHWCKTSAARVGALVPRMNRCLEAARAMGIQVFLCPTDVADNYVGTPQVESLMALPRVTIPTGSEIQCPAAPDGGGCTCGKERCQVNYGWDGMHPDLVIGENDLIPNEPELLYGICQARGITHLIYLGVHTQVCLLGKSVGVRRMLQAGMKCVLARDLTDAHGRYDPAKNLTPDDFTTNVVAHFEKYLVPTVNFVDTLERMGKWDKSWVVDPVRVAPWGKRERPHLFEKELIVTLTAPWEPGAAIHYTLDGSRPTPQSPLYSGPLHLDKTAGLRAIAFQNDRPVCLESEGYFARLGEMPPAPDIALSSLKPLRAVGYGHSPSFSDHRFSPRVNPPQMDLTNEKKPLRLRSKKYERGVGVHAPNQLLYELKPTYGRFVALAGVDEYILDTNNGSNLAMHPSVIFKVFIDGRLAAESPMMRISEEPWRFDVPIQPGSRLISLVATDGGNGNLEDLANWVNCGFVTRN